MGARETAGRRIARARELAATHPATAEILSCYADLTAFQQTFTGPEPILDLIPTFLSWMRVRPVAHLATLATMLESRDASYWRELMRAAQAHDTEVLELADDAALFVVEAVLQPFAEREAASVPQSASGARCPACGGSPVVAVLRERGHGAERSLVCGLCLLEWPTMRMACPSCGETSFEALPVYRAEEFNGIRIDACDSCKVYLKTIDLSVNGSAVPVVDDLASVPLDLWAQQQGYRRLRKNLLRL